MISEQNLVRRWRGDLSRRRGHHPINPKRAWELYLKNRSWKIVAQKMTRAKRGLRGQRARGLRYQPGSIANAVREWQMGLRNRRGRRLHHG